MVNITDQMRTYEARLQRMERKQTHSIMVNELLKFNMPGQLAFQLAQLMVASNRGAPQMPEAVATHACNIADAFFKEAERRGWLLHMPSLDQLYTEDDTKVGF